VVQPVGALWDAQTGAAGYGTIPDLGPIAVADQEGVFELDPFFTMHNGMPPFVSGPPVKILVSVQSRGVAEGFSVIPAGFEPHAIAVADGAVVRGGLGTGTPCPYFPYFPCFPRWLEFRSLRAATLLFQLNAAILGSAFVTAIVGDGHF
jgi:hypothetical protein